MSGPRDSELGAVSPSEHALISWKEIAAHVGCTIRTVQRWEKQAGLPVHRLMNVRRGTIYAYPSELDAWLAERGNRETVAGRFGPTHRQFVAWLAGIAAAAVLLGYTATVWLESTQPRAPLPRQLADLDLRRAAVSPDGDKLVYVARDATLRMRTLPQGPDSVLATRGQVYSAPVWSNDSVRVALISGDGDGQRVLVVVQVENGRSVLVQEFDDPAQVLEPIDWMPGDAALLTRSVDGRVVLVPLESGEGGLESIPGIRVDYPTASVSPNGRWLAYEVRNGNFGPQLWIGDLQGRVAAARLTSSRGREGWSFWSTDGRELFYVDRGHTLGAPSHIRRAPFDTRTGRLESASESIALIPDYSLHLMPGQSDRGTIIFGKQPPATQVIVGEFDALSQTPIVITLESPRGSRLKSWMPNEPVLAFWDPLRRASDEVAFVEHDFRSGTESVRRLRAEALAGANAFNVRPPDYRDALVNVRAGDEVTLYRTDLTSGIRDTLVDPQTFGGSESPYGGASWSPSGDSICFWTRTIDSADDSVRYGLYWMDLATSIPVQITRAANRGGCSISLDDMLINWSDGLCLMVASTTGGSAKREICSSAGRADLARLRRSLRSANWAPSAHWSADNRYLLWPFARADRVDLVTVDRQTGARRVIWAGASGFRSVPTDAQWSADGAMVAINVQNTPSTQIWEVALPMGRE